MKAVVRRRLKRVAKAVVPRPVIWLRQVRRATDASDPELRLVLALARRGDTVLDVGANTGIYTKAALLRGATTIAFEPLVETADALGRDVGGRATIHPVAIGSAGGEARIFVPVHNGLEIRTRASLLADANGAIPLVERTVTVRPLDELVRSASLVKIDVEGAELDVLESASTLLRTAQPTIIIEVEQRHGGRDAADAVFRHLEERGYQGYFLEPSDRRRLRSIREFSFDRDQDPANAKPLDGDKPARYVNNFCFVHHRRLFGVLTQLERRGLSVPLDTAPDEAPTAAGVVDPDALADGPPTIDGETLPMRLSAIVCTRNRSAWSSKAVASLLAQDLPAERFEVIVVDNASTDDTASVLTSLIAGHANAAYVYEPELGLSRARNRGIAQSSGEIVGFLDDDAEAQPCWARQHLATYAAPDVVGTAGRIDLGWPGDRPRWLPRRWEGMYSGLDLGRYRHDLDAPATPYGANMAFRRGALGDGSLFSVSLGRRGDDLTSGEELELFERLRADGGRIVYVPDARVTHHVLADRLGRYWFLRRVWANGRTRVLLAAYTRERRSRLGWLARAGYEALRTVREVLRLVVRGVTGRPAPARMDSLARAMQTAAISKESLLMAFARSRPR